MEYLFDKAQKILILNDLHHLIVNGNIDFKIIQQLYTVIRVFESLNPKIKIAINDQTTSSYCSLWKTNSMLSHYIDRYLINIPLCGIEYSEFDIIICHLAHEIDLNENLKRANIEFPPIYVFHNESTTIPSDKVKPRYIHSIFSSEFVAKCDKETLNSISDFKMNLEKSYQGLSIEKQQVFHKKTFAKITTSNIHKEEVEFKNILYLDDYRRKFYLGDSYIWIVNIRKNIYDIYPEAKLQINCRDEKKLNKLKDIYHKSFCFTCKDWGKIDFNNFDLVLFHEDLTMEFVEYIGKFWESKFKDLSIYSFIETSSKLNKIYPKWSYSHLYSKKVKKDAVSKILSNRKYFELNLGKEELRYGNKWFEANGVGCDKRVAVVIVNASNTEKMLPQKVQLQLILNLIEVYDYKILLFGYEMNKFISSMKKALSDNQLSEILVSYNMTIREELSLISSKYVKVVISPCTGLMHLANGVYYYLLNKKIRKRKDLPLLFIYTGNLTNFLDNYHPMLWWNNTLVRGLVRLKVDAVKNTVPMRKLKGGLSTYDNLSGSLKTLTCEMIIEHLEEYFPKFTRDFRTHQF